MNERKRLMELIEEGYERAGMVLTYEEAIADNLLDNGVIVPPCELNDLVYVVPCRENGLKEIAEMRCIGFAISRDEKIFNLVDWKNKLYQPYFSRFGIDIFLTRKEAEKVLAERSEQ